MALFLKIGGETYRLPDESELADVSTILLEALGRGTAATIRLAPPDDGEGSHAQLVVGSSATHAVVIQSSDDTDTSPVLDISG